MVVITVQWTTQINSVLEMITSFHIGNIFYTEKVQMYNNTHYTIQAQFHNSRELDKVSQVKCIVTTLVYTGVATGNQCHAHRTNGQQHTHSG